jgi:hypothetical protein
MDSMFKEVTFKDDSLTNGLPRQKHHYVFVGDQFGTTRSSSRLIDLSLELQKLRQRVEILEAKDV